jgi:hypothetical protein
MDEQIRRLQRQAAQGDIGAKTSLLRHYLRLGLLKSYHVELAALYGDEASEIIEFERSRNSVGTNEMYYPPYDYSSEYEYLYPTSGCSMCGGTGMITNTAKMSWRDPDTYYCKCTSRPFGGSAFYCNRDDEIYVRRALAAVQFAFDRLDPSYREPAAFGGKATWNVARSIINRIRRFIDTYGVNLSKNWEGFYEDAFLNIRWVSENLQPTEEALLGLEEHPEFEQVLGAISFLLDGCNHLYLNTETALHTQPRQNWVEDAIHRASTSLLTGLENPRPGEDRVIINKAIAAELIPWLLDPSKHGT